MLVSCLMLTTPERSGMRAAALRSFDLQTHPHRELVVVTERERLALPGATVVVVPAGLTVGAKRNAGLAAARGDAVAVWDDDDFSMPERLATQVAILDATGAAYTRSDQYWLADEDLRIAALVKRWSYASALFRRAVAERVGGFPDLSYLEDMEFYIRVAIRGLKTVVRPDRFYVHRRHRANVSSASEAASQSWDAYLAHAVPADVAAATARLAALLA